MNDEKFKRIQNDIEKEKVLQKKAKKVGGRVTTDSQYGRGIHVDKFTFITEDGHTIHEGP